MVSLLFALSVLVASILLRVEELNRGGQILDAFLHTLTQGIEFAIARGADAARRFAGSLKSLTFVQDSLLAPNKESVGRCSSYTGSIPLLPRLGVCVLKVFA